MKIGTAQTLREIDDYCTNNLGIPGIILMENAAIKVVSNIDLKKFHRFTIVCGSGNNGGDGLAIARHLLILDKFVDIFMIGSDNLRDDCKLNLNILKNMGAKINKINNLDDLIQVRDSLNRNDMTIDAIFGTGLSRNVEGIYDQIITVINENSKYILSVDVPSGFQSDNGMILGNCIRADKTVSFELYKKGFLKYNTDGLTGEVIIENIGIPSFVIDKFHKNQFILDKNLIKNEMHLRDKYSHKGDFGRVAIVAGSKGYTGAAYIATQSAVKSGAGLVTLCTKEEIMGILSSKLEEAMTADIESDRFIDIIKNSSALAIGPGMGNNMKTLEYLHIVLKNASCPIIIDADGINVLREDKELLSTYKNEIIITPHVGEMARLMNCSMDYIKENRIEVAEEFAKKYGVIVLLKGYSTIITDGIKTYINPTGNSAMASGGMGDALTGIIAAFLAQGYSALSACSIGAYIHGYCGDVLSKDMFVVCATSIIDKLPKIIKEVQISNR